VAETATSSVGRHYEGEVAKVAALATFVPLLIGTGGNAGAQAVTTITRALALGEVRFSDFFRVLTREISTALILGSILALVGFGRIYLWHVGVGVSFVVAISMFVIVLWAVTVGAALPIILKRCKLDPAVMSAPFITTLVDATGLFFYFSIARIWLNL
jgi:magnesium transporter